MGCTLHPPHLFNTIPFSCIPTRLYSLPYTRREKEAALEVRAMLVASGCSDAQIDAATAAAHGDVNAAAERLYDSSM